MQNERACRNSPVAPPQRSTDGYIDNALRDSKDDSGEYPSSTRSAASHDPDRFVLSSNLLPQNLLLASFRPATPVVHHFPKQNVSVDEASAGREAGCSTPSWRNHYRSSLAPSSTEELGWGPKQRASRATLLDSMAGTRTIVCVW